MGYAVEMAVSTRERIVQTGARLFWRHGFPGTGMKQIVAEAGAPFGSVYHFFPGGKEALGAEAIRWSGEQYAAIVNVAFDLAEQQHETLANVVEDVFLAAGEAVRESGWADACPIATVALEMSGTSEPIRLACDETFESWLAGLGVRFDAHGVPAEHQRHLAITFLTLLEGAFILARTSRSTESLDVAGRAMAAAIRGVVGAE